MTYDKTTQAKILAHAQATTISEAAQKFSVSRLSIYRWRTELEADYVKPAWKPFFHKLNPTEVKAYVESNPNQTCAQIGEHFGASDVGVSVFFSLLFVSFFIEKFLFLKEKPS